MRRWLLLWFLLAGSAAGAREVEVARLTSEPEPVTIAAVRMAPEADWSGSDAIRRQAQPSWWRLRLASDRGGDTVWVLSIRQSFDAELVAYLPPDYRPRALSTFDPRWQQLGSRHRLALQLPAGASDAPVYLRLVEARLQPLRVRAAPLPEYIATDLARVRFTSMMLSALLLLAVVSVVFALALRRRVLLLFALWLLCFFIYLATGSGEIVWMLPDPDLLRHAMALRFLALAVGTVAVFGFVLGFLDLRRHHPGLSRMMGVLIALCAGFALLAVLDVARAVSTQLFNLCNLVLGLLALLAGALRARAGSTQGWFFLLGWGAVTVTGLIGLVFFLRQQGAPEWLDWLHPAANVFGGTVLVLATARAARHAEREMPLARRIARTDALTRLPNRRELDASLEDVVRRARSEAAPLALMFLDLDHFKAINDRHGHALGDACLASVGDILRRHVRATDLIARYGGEEFVLVLEGAGPERARLAAETLRAAVQDEAGELEDRRIALTLSIGLTDLRPDDRASDLLARADAALHRAKQAGRNRVEADFAH